MDLIGMLAQQAGIDSNQAQALAGGLLGAVQKQVADKVGPEDAAQLQEAIPELDGWKATAAKALTGDAHSGGLGDVLGSLMGSGGAQAGMGGLASAAAGMLGGAASSQTGGLDVQFVSRLLTQLNLSPSIAAMAAPMIAEFLRERLPKGLLSKVNTLVPLLGGLSGSGGLAAALGGMFGKS